MNLLPYSIIKFPQSNTHSGLYITQNGLKNLRKTLCHNRPILSKSPKSELIHKKLYEHVL